MVTTASKHSHEYCKELGADKVFDYKDSDWVERAATFIRGRQIAGAFDSTSTENTAGASAEVLARAGSKSLTMTVSPISECQKQIRSIHFWSQHDLQWRPGSSYLVRFSTTSPREGQFVPKPDPLIVGNGLQGIQKGMNMQRSGVSARKVVVTMELQTLNMQARSGVHLAFFRNSSPRIHIFLGIQTPF